MTERAERLREVVREAVGDSFHDGVQTLADKQDAIDILAAIVTKLGITGECHCGKGDVTCSHCGGNLDACAVLLEASR